MRKFWLDIDDGSVIIDLNGLDHVNNTSSSETSLLLLRAKRCLYASKVTGLGFEKDSSFAYSGNLRFRATKKQPKQIVLAGTLSIAPGQQTPYQNYEALLYLIEGKKLAIRYSPHGSTYDAINGTIMTARTYVLDGELTKLTKGELKAGVLECGFEFRAFSPWHTFAELTDTGSVGQGYEVSLTDKLFGPLGTSMDITLTARGAVTAPCCRVVVGSTTVGELYAPELTLAQDDKLRWNTDPAERIITKNGVDVLDMVDLSRNAFLLLPSGAKLVFGSSGGEVMTGQVRGAAKFKEFYRSV